jgi:hypothetical protein
MPCVGNPNCGKTGAKSTGAKLVQPAQPLMVAVSVIAGKKYVAKR